MRIRAAGIIATFVQFYEGCYKSNRLVFLCVIKPEKIKIGEKSDKIATHALIKI